MNKLKLNKLIKKTLKKWGFVEHPDYIGLLRDFYYAVEKAEEKKK